MGICLIQPGIRPSLTRRAIAVIPVQKIWGFCEAVRQTFVDDSPGSIVHQPVSVATQPTSGYPELAFPHTGAAIPGPAAIP